MSLGNVIPSGFKDSPFPFLSPEDRELVIKYAVPAFEVRIRYRIIEIFVCKFFKYKMKSMEAGNN